jgi:hypothetical protein
LQYDKKNLFTIIMERVKDIQNRERLKDYEAFPNWFIKMYFNKVINIYNTDGARDGKIDTIFTTQNGEYVKHYVLNSKFTKEYNKTAPTGFYDEIIGFQEVFNNKSRREKYLNEYVKKEVQHKYQNLLNLYDDSKVELIFLTNCKQNHSQYTSNDFGDYNVTIMHFEDIVQYMIDDLEGAMPKTETLLLTGIHNLLTPSKEEARVPTFLVFAKVADFIDYMKNDEYDLLFARNIRLDLGKTEPNENIKATYRDNPDEFAYSNNGITLICEDIKPDLSEQELRIINPRVVNGSQTLHSVKYVKSQRANARVMLRIIKVGRINSDSLDEATIRRKEIIHNISIRSNLQNPIKKWNLVANDDFQNSLKRYFRHKNLFYETRKDEWKSRKLDLRSVGVSRGPFITKLTQLVGSFYYSQKELGPANAYSRLNELFEDKAYNKIQKTSENNVYKIYLLGKNVSASISLLSSTQYIYEVRKSVFLCIVALYAKLLNENLKVWDHADITDILEGYHIKWDQSEWKAITKDLIKHVFEFYAKENKKYKKEKNIKSDMNLNNYFKNHKYITTILSSKIPSSIIKKAKPVFKL